jgi:hypothetical protein
MERRGFFATMILGALGMSVKGSEPTTKTPAIPVPAKAVETPKVSVPTVKNFDTVDNHSIAQVSNNDYITSWEKSPRRAYAQYNLAIQAILCLGAHGDKEELNMLRKFVLDNVEAHSTEQNAKDWKTFVKRMEVLRNEYCEGFCNKA